MGGRSEPRTSTKFFRRTLVKIWCKADGKTYSEWNQWVGDLALAGLKERSLDEEKFFDLFFEIVMEKGPFGLQAQFNYD